MLLLSLQKGLQEAKAAAELVEISYKDSQAVVDLSASNGEEIHEGMAGNRYFDWELGDEAATEEALSNAAKVVKLKVRNNRVIPNAMEPRAAVAEYDDIADAYIIHNHKTLI